MEPLEDRRVLAVLTVTTPLDTVDLDDGQLSLREAIFVANTVPGHDEIRFDFGHDGPATILLTQGELRISDSLTITGSGASLLTIDAQQQSRIFNVDNGNVFDFEGFDVTIKGLTLTGGQTTGNNETHVSPARENIYSGGAIRSVSYGLLSIEQSAITGNVTLGNGAAGGGIFGLGPMVITECSITNNSTQGRSANGGGVSTPGRFSSHLIIIVDSFISENSTHGFFAPGGGVFSHGATVINTTISRNYTRGDVAGGGGIDANYLTMDSSIVVDNQTIGNNSDGGGTRSEIAQITHSVVSRNTTSGRFSSGGGIYAGGRAFIADSAILENQTLGDNAEGGGLNAENLGLVRSTLSGNRTAGRNSRGGGLMVIGSVGVMSTIHASTVTNNQTTGESAHGGGIAFVSDAIASMLSIKASMLNINESVITDNKAAGANSQGGGVYILGATAGSAVGLTLLDRTTVSNNSAGGNGGGIHITIGRFDIVNSTISGNWTSGSGGGMHATGQRGGILNTTVSGNMAAGDGGGLYARPAMELTISHSTVTDNTANSDSIDGGAGGGIFARRGHIKLDHSILAKNTDRLGNAPDLGFHAEVIATDGVSARSSLIGDNRGSGFVETPPGLPDADGNLIGGPVHGVIDPLLGPLADNGGPTLTHALLPGSPAINRGDLAAAVLQNGVPLFDQRGEPFFRVFGGPGLAHGRIDIGAFEFQDASDLNLLVDTLSDEVNGDYSRGDLSLREAIQLANMWQGMDTIRFDPALAGGAILLTMGELILNDQVTIEGLGADQLTIDASGNDSTPDLADGRGSRIFRIAGRNIPDEPFIISGLTLTGGDAGPEGGAISSRLAHLTIRDSVITGNAARQMAGGVYSALGTLVMIDSVVSNNEAGRGGGVFAGNGDVTIQSSIIADNQAIIHGGGILVSQGNLAVDNSMISGNSLAAPIGMGGGIYFLDQNSAASSRLEISRSTITGNIAARGGGLWVRMLNGTLTFEENTIAENSSTAPTGQFAGGGIDADLQNATATIRHTTISNNTAGRGGGIAARLVNSQLTIADSTISGNTAVGPQAQGGGVLVAGYGGPNNLVTIHRTIIENNTSASGVGDVAGRGGGIYSRVAINITDSTISGNSAATAGGGIAAAGYAATPVSIVRSTVHGNSAGQNGGGIFTQVSAGRGIGGLSVIDSMLSENTAGQDGGGLFASGLVTITSSTLHGNSAGRNGGGLATQVGATLTQSTLSGNTAGALGGGIWTALMPTTLAHSTVFSNQAGSAGGGVFATGMLTANHSIIAGNVAPAGRDLTGLIGTSFTLRHSLIGSNANSGLTPAPVGAPDANGNIIGSGSAINPQLGPLADNGGPTRTHALMPGSPAIGAGDPSLQADVVGVPAHDQRGQPFIRVFGGTIDIGAFDWQPIGILLGDYNRDGMVDAADYLTWREQLGLTVQPGVGADGNGDGDVDGRDFLVWQRNFGSTLPAVGPVVQSPAATDSPAGRPLEAFRPDGRVAWRPLEFRPVVRTATPAAHDLALTAWLTSPPASERAPVRPEPRRAGIEAATDDSTAPLAVVDLAFNELGGA